MREAGKRSAWHTNSENACLLAFRTTTCGTMEEYPVERNGAEADFDGKGTDTPIRRRFPGKLYQSRLRLLLGFVERTEVDPDVVADEAAVKMNVEIVVRHGLCEPRDSSLVPIWGMTGVVIIKDPL